MKSKPELRCTCAISRRTSPGSALQRNTYTTNPAVRTLKYTSARVVRSIGLTEWRTRPRVRSSLRRTRWQTHGRRVLPSWCCSRRSCSACPRVRGSPPRAPQAIAAASGIAVAHPSPPACRHQTAGTDGAGPHRQPLAAPRMQPAAAGLDSPPCRGLRPGGRPARGADPHAAAAAAGGWGQQVTPRAVLPVRQLLTGL